MPKAPETLLGFGFQAKDKGLSQTLLDYQGQFSDLSKSIQEFAKVTTSLSTKGIDASSLVQAAESVPESVKSAKSQIGGMRKAIQKVQEAISGSAVSPKQMKASAEGMIPGVFSPQDLAKAVSSQLKYMGIFDKRRTRYEKKQHKGLRKSKLDYTEYSVGFESLAHSVETGLIDSSDAAKKMQESLQRLSLFPKVMRDRYLKALKDMESRGFPDFEVSEFGRNLEKTYKAMATPPLDVLKKALSSPMKFLGEFVSELLLLDRPISYAFKMYGKRFMDFAGLAKKSFLAPVKGFKWLQKSVPRLWKDIAPSAEFSGVWAKFVDDLAVPPEVKKKLFDVSKIISKKLLKPITLSQKTLGRIPFLRRFFGKRADIKELTSSLNMQAEGFGKIYGFQKKIEKLRQILGGKSPSESARSPAEGADVAIKAMKDQAKAGQPSALEKVAEKLQKKEAAFLEKHFGAEEDSPAAGAAKSMAVNLTEASIDALSGIFKGTNVTGALDSNLEKVQAVLGGKIQDIRKMIVGMLKKEEVKEVMKPVVEGVDAVMGDVRNSTERHLGLIDAFTGVFVNTKMKGHLDQLKIIGDEANKVPANMASSFQMSFRSIIGEKHAFEAELLSNFAGLAAKLNPHVESMARGMQNSLREAISSVRSEMGAAGESVEATTRETLNAGARDFGRYASSVHKKAGELVEELNELGDAMRRAAGYSSPNILLKTIGLFARFASAGRRASNAVSAAYAGPAALEEGADRDTSVASMAKGGGHIGRIASALSGKGGLKRRLASALLGRRSGRGGRRERGGRGIPQASAAAKPGLGMIGGALAGLGTGAGMVLGGAGAGIGAAVGGSAFGIGKGIQAALSPFASMAESASKAIVGATMKAEKISDKPIRLEGELLVDAGELTRAFEITVRTKRGLAGASR